MYEVCDPPDWYFPEPTIFGDDVDTWRDIDQEIQQQLLQSEASKRFIDRFEELIASEDANHFFKSCYGILKHIDEAKAYTSYLDRYLGEVSDHIWNFLAVYDRNDHWSPSNLNCNLIDSQITEEMLYGAIEDANRDAASHDNIDSYE